MTTYNFDFPKDFVIPTNAIENGIQKKAVQDSRGYCVSGTSTIIYTITMVKIMSGSDNKDAVTRNKPDCV